MSDDATMPVTVIIERRSSNSPWQDHVWLPIGVLPIAASEDWKLLAEGNGWAQFQAGGLQLELHRAGTEGYLVNLSQTPPVVYVVLRGAESGGMDIEPFLATVCPYEAMSYDKGGDHVVEGVAMPPEVVAWVAEFVERHHVEVPFQKRKNKRHEDDVGGANSNRRRREAAS
jgi:hypothetical protein